MMSLFLPRTKTNCMHGGFPQRPLACALSRFAAIEPVRGALLSYFVIAHAGHGFAGLTVNRIPPSYRVANGRRLNACRPSACRKQPSSLVNSASFTPHSRQLVRINTRPASVCRVGELQASRRPTSSERALRPASSTHPNAAPDSAHQPPPQLLLVAPKTRLTLHPTPEAWNASAAALTWANILLPGILRLLLLRTALAYLRIGNTPPMRST